MYTCVDPLCTMKASKGTKETYIVELLLFIMAPSTNMSISRNPVRAIFM